MVICHDDQKGEILQQSHESYIPPCIQASAYNRGAIRGQRSPAGHSDEKEKIKISELQYAILNKQAIRFCYFNSEFQKTEREAEPLRLIFKSHAWYIVGYCRMKQEIRIFRLSRIKRLYVWVPARFGK